MQKPRLRRCSTHWPAIFESSEIDTFHRYVLTYASSQCRLKTGHGKIAKQALFVVASHTLHSSFACLHALAVSHSRDNTNPSMPPSECPCKHSAHLRQLAERTFVVSHPSAGDLCR